MGRVKRNMLMPAGLDRHDLVLLGHEPQGEHAGHEDGHGDHQGGYLRHLEHEVAEHGRAGHPGLQEVVHLFDEIEQGEDGHEADDQKAEELQELAGHV